MEITKLITECDTQNLLNVLTNSHKQIQYAFFRDLSHVKTAITNKQINNIILTGLGGSAIAGDLIQNFLRNDLKVSFSVNRNYNLPLSANENTLLLVSSYSGNTEETISVLKEAIEKNIPAVCFSTGGIISDLAKKNNLPLVELEKGYQPRYALGMSFFSLLKVLQTLEFIPDQTKTVEKIVNLWEKKGIEYTSESNKALDIAFKILGFIPVVYSVADFNNAVGNRFKGEINENSKVHCFHNIFPELNHNEIIGWEDYLETHFKAYLIVISDPDIHPQIKKRIQITSELIARRKVDFLVLESDETDFKLRLMDLTLLVDWISYYLAILRKKDPAEIDYINLLKEKLA